MVRSSPRSCARIEVLRDLGVYEKLVNAMQSPSVRSLQSTRSGPTQPQQSGREPVQLRARLVARASQSGDGPDRYAGSPPLERQALISIAANQKQTFPIMHIDVPSACFHAKAQRPVLVRLLVGDKRVTTLEKLERLKNSMCGTRDAASHSEGDWQEHLKSWGYQLGDGSARRICFDTSAPVVRHDAR